MAFRVRCWLVLLVMFGAAPVMADDAGEGLSVPMPVRAPDAAMTDVQLAQEDRIAELERTVSVLVNELERERSARAFPEEAPLSSEWGHGPAASKVYKVGQGLSVGGYGEAYYSKLIADSADGKDRADALRTVLYVGYKFTDSILFNGEFEFEHATTGSTESSGGGSVSAEFAALDFLWKDWANFRAGLVLLPMGFINEIHEPPSFFGTHRPEVERQIIPSTWREVGTGVFGTLFDEEVEFSMYVVNGMNAKGFRTGGLRDGRQKGNRALAENLAFVGRLDWTPIPGLLVGASVYHGNSGQHQDFDVNPGGGLPSFHVDIPTTPTTIWEAHAQYVNQGFWLRGLVTMAHIQENGALSRALAPTSEGGVGELESGEGIGGQMLGVYGEVAYDVLPLLFPNTEKSLEPFLRVEYYDTQRDMPTGFLKDYTKEITIFTAGVSFKPISNVVIKADYRNRSAAHGELSDELNMGVGFAF
jgi:hypothetical protein